MNLKEMKARLTEIAAEAKIAEVKNDSEALDKLLDEANEISAKIEKANKLNRLQKIADECEDGGKMEEPGGENSTVKRGKALMNGEKVHMNKAIISPKASISLSNTVTPQHTATDVKETFNDVSNIIDTVKAISFDGGESYKRGFVKSYGEGDYTAEGEDYKETDPSTDVVEIKKTKITAYTEEPDEIRKLAPAAYDNTIKNSVSRSVRKKIANQIIIGDGKTDHICGIFNAPENVIPKSSDISVSEITATTLDEIIYSFGGDEDVEGFCGLILNKSDLKAFATLRNADGHKVYDVKPNGNTGTIDNIPYIISSACPAVSNSKTTVGAYCMAYGPYQNYELALFSDIDVEESAHYKFRSGQIAHRADVYVGGGVAAYKGFLRIKKAAAEA